MNRRRWAYGSLDFGHDGTGLAALLHASPVVFQAVKYLGVAYLVCMTVAPLRERGGLRLPGAGAQARSFSDLRAVRNSVLVNLLNPKLTVFFVALFPQFLDPASPDPRQAAPRVRRLVPRPRPQARL